MKFRILFYFFFLLSITSNAKNQAVDELLTFLKNTPSDTAKIQAYAKIVQTYSITHKDSATFYLNIARQFAAKINSLSSVALLDLTEAELLQSHGEFLPARKITLHALDIYYNLNNALGLANTYHMLGVLDGKLGNYSMSTSYLLRSLRFNEKLKNKQGIASNYLALGLVNLYIHNFKKSEIYLVNCLNLSKEIGSQTYIDACNNLGSLMGMKADDRKALYYFELALASLNENSKTSTKINIILNIAISYSNLQNPEKSFRFYDEALKLSTKYDMPETQARVLHNIGVTYENTNPKLALKYFEDALVIAKRLSIKSFCVEIYEAIYTIKTALKDYKGAVEAFEMFHLYSDSVLSTQNKTEIELLQSNFDLEKSKAEIVQLELNKEKHNLQKTIAGVLIFAILAILGVVAFTSNKRKKLNADLLESVLVRDKLLSVISHDLKSPINSILLLLDELGKGDLTSQEKIKLLEDLKRQTQLSMVTLDNILKWGQLQIRGINTNPQEFLLMEIIQRNLDFFEMKAKNKGLLFELNFDRNLKVLTDIDQLDFVVRNLFSNAIKYSYNNASIIVQAQQHSLGKIIVTIQDNGIGMDYTTLKSLFGVNPILNAGTANEKGSGLGLLLCKDFVEANGGSIWLESIINSGTKVSFICNSSI